MMYLNSQRKLFSLKTILYFGVGVILLICASLLYVHLSSNANAMAISGFKAGDIMSDAVMSNSGTMSESQINNFLHSKNSCDKPVAGSGVTVYSSTRAYTKGTLSGKAAIWWWNIKGGANGHFVCMADDTFSGQTAAHVIYRAARDYNINPQVLIVLLQKEQGLITDQWPNDHQYAAATGYNCPDTPSGCNNANAGFITQVRDAASLFHDVLTGGWSNYPVGDNVILYNPSTSCGSSHVNIVNRATSALYRYTPYQPNSATLKAGWPSPGVSCGAYGNLNFYMYFTTWFGSTHQSIGMSGISIEDQPFTDTPTTASFTLTNYTKSTLNLGDIKIAVRDPNNVNKDFAYAYNVSIKPGKTYTYKSTRTLDGAEGTYTMFIARLDGGSWHYPTFDDYKQDGDGSLTRKITKQPTLVSPLSLSPNAANIHNGQKVTASFAIKNNSSLPVNIGYIKPAMRDANQRNLDFPYTSSDKLILSPGQTYIYSGSVIIPHTGAYSVWVAAQRDGYSWSTSFPASKTANMVRSIDFNAKESATLTQPLKITRSDTHGGNSVNATFTVHNFSTTNQEIGYIKPAVRDSKDNNYDLPYSSYVILAPGQDYTYNDSRVLPEGSYNFWIANLRNGQNWSKAFPENETSGLVRNTTLEVGPQVTLTAPLSVTMPNNHDGGSASATFTVKNNGTTTAEVGYIKPAVRDSKNNGYDFPYSPYVTLAPGASYTYNDSRTLPAGKFHIWIANLRNGQAWSETFPASETTGMVRSMDMSVKDAVTLTQPLKVTMNTYKSGNTARATFTVKNFGTKTAEVGYIKPAVRDSKSHNLDFPYSPYIKLAPGTSYTYSESREMPYADNYTIWIADLRTNKPWSNTFPSGENSSITRKISLDLKNEARLTKSLELANSGGTYTATFTIKNYGSSPAEIGYIKPAVRDSANNGYDFPYSPYITLPPGASYTYSDSRALPNGAFHIWIANLRNGKAWSETYPVSETSDLTRSIDLVR